MSSEQLDDKQRLFCDRYLIHFNASKAAEEAGYSKKTAAQQASRLLTKVNIQAYLAARKEKMAEKLEITQERVLQEYARLAFSDIRKLFTVDGALKPIAELDDDTAAVLSSVEIHEEEVTARDIESDEKIVAGITKKVKLWDKRAALDSICKVMGYNAPEKIEHSGDSFLDMLMQTSTHNTSEDQPRKKKKPKPKAKKPTTKPRRKR